MKGPAIQFYFGDWLRCAEVRLCSLAARGLWIDMLGFMHQAQPYGHLVFKGKPVDAKNLANMVGGGSTTAGITKLLKELRDNGVYSLDDNGVIYCRRMVRDELKREAWKHQQQAHRDRVKALEDAEHQPLNRKVSVDSQPNVSVGVMPESARSSVLPSFPSSKPLLPPASETSRSTPKAAAHSIARAQQVIADQAQAAREQAPMPQALQDLASKLRPQAAFRTRPEDEEDLPF